MSSILNEISQDNGKITFKCKHCENDDIRYMQFSSLNKQSLHPMYYRQNFDYETTPKIPIGVHIKCGKCGKDTFIIPNMYPGLMWGSDIPEQCVVNVVYEHPKFSAKKYIINNEGLLDVVVQTMNNELVSILNQDVISDTINVTEIPKEKYEMLVSKGLPTVTTVESQNLNTNTQGGKNESTNVATNDFRKRPSKPNNEKMGSHESRTETK